MICSGFTFYINDIFSPLCSLAAVGARGGGGDGGEERGGEEEEEEEDQEQQKTERKYK